MDAQYLRTLLFGATPQAALVHVEVVALDEENNAFHWHARLLLHQRLRDLAVAWSDAYGVPVEQVEFETEDYEQLQLSQTAWQLAWTLQRCGKGIVSALPAKTTHNFKIIRR